MNTPARPSELDTARSPQKVAIAAYPTPQPRSRQGFILSSRSGRLGLRVVSTAAIVAAAPAVAAHRLHLGLLVVGQYGHELGAGVPHQRLEILADLAELRLLIGGQGDCRVKIAALLACAPGRWLP